MMDDLLDPSRAPGPLGQHRGVEALGDDLAQAVRRTAKEPSHDELPLDVVACAGQLRWPATYWLWVRRDKVPQKGQLARCFR